MRMLALFVVGVVAGGMIAVQAVLNAALGKRTGDLGSVLLVTLVSIAVVVPLLLIFPGTSNLRALPGPSQWYLYLGGVAGVIIVGVPILLVPRIGATATVTALIVGQLTLAVIIDHFGWLGTSRSELSLTRALGVAVLVLGTLLIVRK